jgi:hypothetical protein
MGGIVSRGKFGGLQHTMTVDFRQVGGGHQRLRISTNMELFWDCIFVARILDAASLSVQTAAVENGDLHYLGYPREYSPDGRLPNLYDYENIDGALPWKLMGGDYTRYGEVTGLLERADDCFVIMGRGEDNAVFGGGIWADSGGEAANLCPENRQLL